MIRHNTIIIFLLIIFYHTILYSQNTSEKDVNTLTQETYENLEDNFLQLENDTLKAIPYAKAFLKKAIQANDDIKKADGYYMMAKVSEYKEALLYADSIITITKDKENFDYPAQAHLFKANILGAQSYFQESMNQLAKANTYANANENTEQQYQIKYFIALLKGNLEENEESLEILKDVVSYYESKYIENESIKNKNDYIKALYAYGNAFNIVEDYDSAQKVNDKAIRLTLKSKDSIIYDRLLLSSAIVHYERKEYNASLDSIKKIQEITKTKKSSLGTSIRTEFYLGQIYFDQQKFDLALPHLKKVDSSAFKRNYFFPDIRHNYELLIEYYKKRKNTEKRLFYIDKLLKVDSILDDDVKYLSHNINEEYSKPNLILEKQQIIESLQKKNITKIIVIVVFLILIVIIILRNNKKQKVYQQRFQELLEKNKATETTFSEEKETKDTVEKETKEIGISEIIVNDILKNLKKFEENKDYLQSNISVSSLSKRFKTNSKYFSKVINAHKNKSFSNYVNELRINYVVEELKTNTKFRKYTIRAIANEIGFNTTEAFSKSFYKTTGIYPSFFMKQLEKQESSKNT